MLQRRRGCPLREVVGPLCDEQPVRNPEEGSDGVVAQGRGGLRREEFARRHHRKHHGDQRGQQPPRTSDPEARQRDSPGTAEFVEQQRGDQEPAEHEEDVDTEKSAGNTGDAAVLGKDEPDRDGANAVQRGNALRPSAIPARRHTDRAHCAKFRGPSPPNPRRRARYLVSAMYFVSRYSSMPSVPPSRPKPDCLTPPNGAAGSEMTPRLTPTMPASRPSATRSARSSDRV